VPLVGDYAGTIAAGVQLYVPLLLVGYLGITRKSLGLSRDHLLKDFGLAAFLCLLTIIPFAIGHHYWQTSFNGRSFAFALPTEFAYSIVVQFLAVALPEELFFRGYLLQRMSQRWPIRGLNQKGLGGLCQGVKTCLLSKAVLVSSLVFAFAHFVGEYRIDRLATFFPALVFAYLRLKTGRLLAPVTYHAFCNLLSELVYASYRGTPNS
jgi:hypothetical protein